MAFVTRLDDAMTIDLVDEEHWQEDEITVDFMLGPAFPEKQALSPGSIRIELPLGLDETGRKNALYRFELADLVQQELDWGSAGGAFDREDGGLGRAIALRDHLRSLADKLDEVIQTTPTVYDPG